MKKHLFKESDYQIESTELAGGLVAFFGGWLAGCALFAAFDTKRRFYSDRTLKILTVIGCIGGYAGTVLHDKGNVTIDVHVD